MPSEAEGGALITVTVSFWACAPIQSEEAMEMEVAMAMMMDLHGIKGERNMGKEVKSEAAEQEQGRERERERERERRGRGREQVVCVVHSLCS